MGQYVDIHNFHPMWKVGIRFQYPTLDVFLHLLPWMTFKLHLHTCVTLAEEAGCVHLMVQYLF